MHPTSFKLMEKLVETYAQGVVSVLDIGSMDVNGSYKPLFSPAYNYVGLDPEITKSKLPLAISGQL